MHNSLSITNAKGRLVNLLNDDSKTKINEQRKRYHCSEPGCQKSFTTSGHLARHHRIHTGEKNFHCIYPGCPSRFSRQDNMMQHYRTHLSSRSRHHYYTNHHHQRQQEQQILHCHSYFRSEKTELYSLTSLPPTNKSRGWSMSSSSSSDTLSYYPPHPSTTTPISLPPDHSTKPYQLQPQKLPVQNWNHPDHKYSPALYHDYHLI